LDYTYRQKGRAVILHTLFQTSIKYPSIRRFDEYFCVDLIVEDGRCQGVVAIEIATGEFALVAARAIFCSPTTASTSSRSTIRPCRAGPSGCASPRRRATTTR
jgi:succinate dehydrogenase/fumarate reductase flavoprotein subunit